VLANALGPAKILAWFIVPFIAETRFGLIPLVYWTYQNLKEMKTSSKYCSMVQYLGPHGSTLKYLQTLLHGRAWHDLQQLVYHIQQSHNLFQMDATQGNPQGCMLSAPEFQLRLRTSCSMQL
jgi:hypothetical protein